jgi:hypothetical protein
MRLPFLLFTYLLCSCSGNQDGHPCQEENHERVSISNKTIAETLSTAPQFPGGPMAMQKYFEKNVSCIDTVYWRKKNYSKLCFDVDTDGTPGHFGLYNCTLLSEDNAEDNNCWKAIMNMPKWTPATAYHKKIKWRVEIPIKLKHFY